MDRSNAPSLLERRAAQLRLDVAAVAMRLFAEEGDTHATVERIASEAGISARTFHRHFPVKADVVRPLFRRSADLVIRRLEEASQDADPLGELTDALLAESAPTGMSDDERRFMVVIAESAEYRLRWLETDEELADAVTEFLAARIPLDPGPTLRALPGRLVVEASRHVFDRWLTDEPDTDLRDLMHRALAMALADSLRPRVMADEPGPAVTGGAR